MARLGSFSLIYRSSMAHLKWWISIVGAHGVRPISPSNLFHNFSRAAPVEGDPSLLSLLVLFISASGSPLQ
ncbi:hypothetical protein [Coleofasciculus sp. G2-EDA-02]|uniref:hypothetical protein n=1 Tax=Coleofasciculus sp. G2-EDA-02 TaxID=3069529 RepID=UPI0032F97BE1